MRFEWKTIAGVAAVVVTCGFGGLGLVGCGEQEEAGPNSNVTQVESEIRRHHWQRGMGNHGAGSGSGGDTGGGGGTATGGSSGGGPITKDCALCDRANDCCNAVNGGALCTFSSNTCEAVAAASRAPYIEGCLIMLNAGRGANLPSPPAACNF